MSIEVLCFLFQGFEIYGNIGQEQDIGENVFNNVVFYQCIFVLGKSNVVQKDFNYGGEESVDSGIEIYGRLS